MRPMWAELPALFLQPAEQSWLRALGCMMVQVLALPQLVTLALSLRARTDRKWRLLSCRKCSCGSPVGSSYAMENGGNRVNVPGEQKSRHPLLDAGLIFYHQNGGFHLRNHQNGGIKNSPKQLSFGWTKEPTMSIKLSFQVRFGKWRLTLSISR
jgi:hypothetical protein